MNRLLLIAIFVLLISKSECGKLRASLQSNNNDMDSSKPEKNIRQLKWIRKGENGYTRNSEKGQNDRREGGSDVISYVRKYERDQDWDYDDDYNDDYDDESEDQSIEDMIYDYASNYLEREYGVKAKSAKRRGRNRRYDDEDDNYSYDDDEDTDEQSIEDMIYDYANDYLADASGCQGSNCKKTKSQKKNKTKNQYRDGGRERDRYYHDEDDENYYYYDDEEDDEQSIEGMLYDYANDYLVNEFGCEGPNCKKSKSLKRNKTTHRAHCHSHKCHEHILPSKYESHCHGKWC